MKNFSLIKKFLTIIFIGIICHTSAHSFSSYNKYVGKGELKISKYNFDLLEFYFSTGKYGEIYNNPQADWQKEMIKKVWKPGFFIISENGIGSYWYYSPAGQHLDTSPNYLGKARNLCAKRGHGECFVFAIKDKIVWQNGINTAKGTRIKKKEARNGMVSIKLKELGFYDGGITKTKKIEKKKEEKKKEPKKKMNDDVVQQLKDLIEMYDTGILTKEEFENAKKKLLN